METYRERQIRKKEKRKNGRVGERDQREVCRKDRKRNKEGKPKSVRYRKINRKKDD